MFQIFDNFSLPDWNPPKQSLGQILDKFGVSGVFEGCKGEKGSQVLLSMSEGLAKGWACISSRQVTRQGKALSRGAAVTVGTPNRLQV